MRTKLGKRLAPAMAAVLALVVCSCAGKDKPKSGGGELLKRGTEQVETALAAVSERGLDDELRAQLRGGVETLGRAADETPESPRPWIQMGRALVALGESQAAVSHYERAYQLNARDGEFVAELALLYLNDNRPGDAADILKPLLSLTESGVGNTTQPPLVYLYAAESLLALEQFEQAQTVYEFIVNRGRQLSAWADYAETAAARLNQLAGGGPAEADPEAVMLLNRGIAAVEQADSVFLRTGDEALRNELLDQAAEIFARAAEIDSDYARPYAGMGTVLRHKGDFEAAIAKYEKAVSLRPDYPVALYNLALCYRDLDRPDKAAEHFEQTLELDPWFVLALIDYALLLESMKEVSRAAELYGRVVEIAPAPAPTGRDITREARLGLERTAAAGAH